MFAATADPTDPVVRARVVDARIAELQAIINAANGELVELLAEAIPAGGCVGQGVETPATYLAWRAGISSAHARDLVTLAERAEAIPTCVAAVRAGTLTVDQAVVIARHVPSAYEAAATAAATQMTVRQLRRALPKYGYTPPGDDSGPDQPSPTPPPEPERYVTSGTDERGWWLRARLSPEEGAVVDTAIAAMRDDRFRRESKDRADGRPPQVSDADGLVCAAEAALRAGQALHPGAERYLVHLHLEESPDGAQPGVLSRHLGARLPDHVHRLLLCDCTLRGVREHNGTPVSVGRRTRVISPRLRRLIEHRDGGCRVPGCGHQRGLDIHHIQHWEDLGPTDTPNLVALCRRHHTAHHNGLLGVEGDADLPPGSEGSLEFRDRWGRVMAPSAEPVAVDPEADLAEVAAERGAAPTHAFSPPTGERLRPLHFFLDPASPPRAGPPASDAA